MKGIAMKKIAVIASVFAGLVILSGCNKEEPALQPVQQAPMVVDGKPCPTGYCPKAVKIQSIAEIEAAEKKGANKK
jgi:hypothetical protein